MLATSIVCPSFVCMCAFCVSVWFLCGFSEWLDKCIVYGMWNMLTCQCAAS
jgi:hypothetical protein